MISEEVRDELEQGESKNLGMLPIPLAVVLSEIVLPERLQRVVETLVMFEILNTDAFGKTRAVSISSIFQECTATVDSGTLSIIPTMRKKILQLRRSSVQVTKCEADTEC